jgi:hypothetical protein
MRISFNRPGFTAPVFVFFSLIILASLFSPAQSLPPLRESNPSSSKRDDADPDLSNLPATLLNVLSKNPVLAKALCVEAAIGLISRASMHASVMRRKFWPNFDQVGECHTRSLQTLTVPNHIRDATDFWLTWSKRRRYTCMNVLVELGSINFMHSHVFQHVLMCDSIPSTSTQVALDMLLELLGDLLLVSLLSHQGMHIHCQDTRVFGQGMNAGRQGIHARD